MFERSNTNKIETLENNIIDYARLAKANDAMHRFICEISEGEDKEICEKIQELILEALRDIKRQYTGCINEANELIFGLLRSNTEDRMRLNNMFQLIHETHMLIRDRF